MECVGRISPFVVGKLLKCLKSALRADRVFSGSKNYELALTWTDPTDDSTDNNMDLYLTPAYHDGSSCPFFLNCGFLLSSEDEDADFDAGNVAEEVATLTTLDDGTKYQDYTYAVFANKYSGYNLSEGGPTLTVEYDGMVKQTLAVPQYRPTGANVNYQELRYYFFGCFRPQFGFELRW